MDGRLSASPPIPRVQPGPAGDDDPDPVLVPAPTDADELAAVVRGRSVRSTEGSRVRVGLRLTYLLSRAQQGRGVGPPWGTKWAESCVSRKLVRPKSSLAGKR